MAAEQEPNAAASEDDSSEGPLHRYSRGVRASLGNNAAAYAYSVMITATFGVLTSILGPSAVFDVFTFAVGAATGRRWSCSAAP
jgi:hypothetical protein